MAMRFIKKRWYWLLLVAMALLTLYMDVYVAKNVLDGDTSDYLYWARTIAQEKNPFTSDYYFSTELRLLDVSFIFSLFFFLTDSWLLVRILGTITMQAIYVASFLFMTRQAGIRRPARVAAAALMLSPFSAGYARIVLYQLHYILYISNALWIVGLTLLTLKRLDSPRRAVLPACLLGVLWLFVGINGVRHMMIIGAPMLAYCLLRCYRALNRTDHSLQPFWQTEVLRLTAVLAASCVCFLAGYMLNQRVLIPYYGIINSSATTFTPTQTADHYAAILNGWLTAIGVRHSSQPVMGLRGLSLLAALFSFGWLLWRSLRSLGRDLPAGEGLTRGLLGLGFAVTTLAFALENGTRWYDLYYVPVIVLAFPLLAWEMEDILEAARPLGVRLAGILCCVCFLFQGAYTAYYLRVDRGGMDAWSGLPVQNLNLTDECRDCVAFMQQNGYTHGVMQYWYANVMMELSDGDVTMLPYLYTLEPGVLQMYQWGTSKTAMRRENLPDRIPVFVIHQYADDFQANHPSAVCVWQGWKFTAFEMPTDDIL